MGHESRCPSTTVEKLPDVKSVEDRLGIYNCEERYARLTAARMNPSSAPREVHRAVPD